jgi:hypothetical protein
LQGSHSTEHSDISTNNEKWNIHTNQGPCQTNPISSKGKANRPTVGDRAHASTYSWFLELVGQEHWPYYTYLAQCIAGPCAWWSSDLWICCHSYPLIPVMQRSVVKVIFEWKQAHICIYSYYCNDYVEFFAWYVVELAFKIRNIVNNVIVK